MGPAFEQTGQAQAKELVVAGWGGCFADEGGRGGAPNGAALSARCPPLNRPQLELPAGHWVLEAACSVVAVVVGRQTDTSCDGGGVVHNCRWAGQGY